MKIFIQLFIIFGLSSPAFAAPPVADVDSAKAAIVQRKADYDDALAAQKLDYNAQKSNLRASCKSAKAAVPRVDRAAITAQCKQDATDLSDQNKLDKGVIRSQYKIDRLRLSQNLSDARDSAKYKSGSLVCFIRNGSRRCFTAK